MMKKNVIPYLCGTLFAIGLGISQMTRPPKILGFLNILGDWDPTLLVVFAAAVGVYAVSYRWIIGESIKKTVIESLSSKQEIDAPLIFGAVVFGIGWGMIGLCPGPALTDLLSFKPAIFVFLAGMVGGIYLMRILSYRKGA